MFPALNTDWLNLALHFLSTILSVPFLQLHFSWEVACLEQVLVRLIFVPLLAIETFSEIFWFKKRVMKTYLDSSCFYRWHLSWRWVVEKDTTFPFPSLEIPPRTINNLKTGRRTKTRILRWKPTWRRKEATDAAPLLVHGRPCRKGGRTTFTSPRIPTGIQLCPIATCCSPLRATRTMLGPSSASHPPQVFCLSHQATGYPFLLNLLIKK